MKRNYSYLQGGNLPQKKLPKLDDQDIEKLYKFYSSKDKFHKKFQGTKRDYCYKATDLINNFLYKNQLGKNGMSGGVRFERTDTPEERELKIKGLIDFDSGKVKVRNVIKEKNIYTRGEFKDIGSPNFWKLEPTDTFDLETIKRKVNEYRSIINLYVDDEVAQTNFLLASNFPAIDDITPEGVKQRSEFSRRAGRKETGAGSDDWNETDEAAFRTEYEYVKNVLVPLGYYRDERGNVYSDTLLRFICLQKCFSEKAKYEVVDFPMSDSLFEEKGNKTVGARSKGFQVDTKKISEVIFNSFKSDDELPSTRTATGIRDWKARRVIRTNPKYCHISFFKYTDNSAMCKIIRDPVTGELQEEDRESGIPASPGIPVEGIVDWDLSDMLKSPAGVKVISKLKDKIQEYNKTFEPKTATKILKNKVVDDLMFGLVMNYFETKTPSHIGAYKGGTKGLTTLTLDYNKLPKLKDKLNLLVYAPELLGPREKNMSGFIEAVKDSENTDNFFITGSRKLENVEREIDSISSKERTENTTFPFIPEPDVSDIFSLAATTDAAKDIKTKLKLIVGEEDVTKPALVEWIKDSGYGHLINRKTGLPRIQDIVLRIFNDELGDLEPEEEDEPEAASGDTTTYDGPDILVLQKEFKKIADGYAAPKVKAKLEAAGIPGPYPSKNPGLLQFWWTKTHTRPEPEPEPEPEQEEIREKERKEQLIQIIEDTGINFPRVREHTSEQIEKKLNNFFDKNTPSLAGMTPEQLGVMTLEEKKNKYNSDQEAAAAVVEPPTTAVVDVPPTRVPRTITDKELKSKYTKTISGMRDIGTNFTFGNVRKIDDSLKNVTKENFKASFFRYVVAKEEEEEAKRREAERIAAEGSDEGSGEEEEETAEDSDSD